MNEQKTETSRQIFDSDYYPFTTEYAMFNSIKDQYPDGTYIVICKDQLVYAGKNQQAATITAQRIATREHPCLKKRIGQPEEFQVDSVIGPIQASGVAVG